MDSTALGGPKERSYEKTDDGESPGGGVLKDAQRPPLQGISSELALLLGQLPDWVQVIVLDDLTQDGRNSLAIRPGIRLVILLGHAPRADYAVNLPESGLQSRDGAYSTLFIRRDQSPQKIYQECRDFTEKYQ